MGITSIFNNNADLSGLLENIKNLKVTDAIHKAYIEVDEFGTTAAAATGIFNIQILTFKNYLIWLI